MSFVSFVSFITFVSFAVRRRATLAVVRRAPRFAAGTRRIGRPARRALLARRRGRAATRRPPREMWRRPLAARAGRGGPSQSYTIAAKIVTNQTNFPMTALLPSRHFARGTAARSARRRARPSLEAVTR
ncbi:hypothetical protein [Burkholderia pseudomallei]